MNLIEFTVITDEDKQATIEAPYRLLWYLGAINYVRKGILPEVWLMYRDSAIVYTKALMNVGIIAKGQADCIIRFVQYGGKLFVGR